MPPAVTSTRLASDLRRLGVEPDGITMVHTRMSALGWVVGGSETVVRALLDAVGPDGTVMAYAGWQEHVYAPEDWPEEHRAEYLAEPPVYDPATAEAVHDHGRIPERLRTWPGAHRSGNPEASMVAVGSRAEWVIALHGDDDGYGAESPLARLVEAGGQVLLLGAPLDCLTLVHHAEAIARAPGKRRVAFRLLVATDGGVEGRAYSDIDTGTGAYPYDGLGLDEDYIAAIGRAALAAGIGRSGRVGESESHLFPARGLTELAVTWIEERFGSEG